MAEHTEEEAPLEGAIIPTRMMKEINQRTVVIILTKEDSLEATLEGEIAIEADLAIQEEGHTLHWQMLPLSSSGAYHEPVS